MIEVSADLNAAMMQAAINRIDVAGAGFIKLYPAPRAASVAAAPANVSVCTITLALPCGTVNATTGALDFNATDNVGVNGQITSANPFTWVRLFDANGAGVQDFDARLSGAADAGQELVFSASAVFVGGFLRLASGGFSA